jgi:bifunctional non-homologous end joining protein LigD
MSSAVVELAGKRLALSNLEKDLYPSHGFTKAQVLEYYRRIAPFMLPHLQGRAVTLKRYPNGVEEEFFFEKRCPAHRPDWVATAEVIHKEDRLQMCVANDIETLLWLGNLAALELHVPLAKAATPATPDSIVFDLDPGDRIDILQCARVAVILRELLNGMGLVSVIKSSGKKGLHVYVPLNRDETTFEDTKMFSKAVAEIMQKHYPDLVTAKMAKTERVTKVFINWSQNDAGKTMICTYSLRGSEKPFVSSPLAWDEIETALKTGDLQKLHIISDEAVRRVELNGDLFHAMLVMEQKLPHL